MKIIKYTKRNKEVVLCLIEDNLFVSLYDSTTLLHSATQYLFNYIKYHLRSPPSAGILLDRWATPPGLRSGLKQSSDVQSTLALNSINIISGCWHRTSLDTGWRMIFFVWLGCLNTGVAVKCCHLGISKRPNS